MLRHGAEVEEILEESSSPLAGSSKDAATVGYRKTAKQRRKDGEAGQWQLTPIKSVKLFAVEDYIKLVHDSPTGPLLDAAAQDSQRLRGGRRRWLPSRAHRLPFVKAFVVQLHGDVALLLDTFVAQWTQTKLALEISDAKTKGKKRAISNLSPSQATEIALAGPLALFVGIWKDLGWHLVQLHWSEEAETRARFFEVTSRAFLSPFYDLDPSSLAQDDLLRATGSIFALYLLHALQPVPPVPIAGLHNRYYRWALLPGQSANEGWDPHAETGRSRIKVEVDLLDKILAIPLAWQATMRLSAVGIATIQESCEGGHAVSPEDERLDFGADVRYAIRKLYGEEASPDSTGTGLASALHVLPQSSIPGIRNPPYLPFFKEVNGEVKQRMAGEWGHLKPKLGSGSSSESNIPPISLTRADNIRIRAAEQLGQPLNSSVLPFLEDGMTNPSPRLDDSSTEYEFVQQSTATSWASSWIEVPFRSKDLARLAKWEARQRNVEQLKRTYEDSKKEMSNQSTVPTDPSALLHLDLVKLMDGDNSWSGRGMEEQLHEARNIPLASVESIFEQARKMTGDTILKGMTQKDKGLSQIK